MRTSRQTEEAAGRIELVAVAAPGGSLDLGDLRLEALPDQLANLTALTRLDIDNNQLTELPDWLGNLTKLTTLVLDNNQLTELPDGLGNLTALTQLSLNNNRISKLHDWLTDLPKLEQLLAADNPLSSPPPEIARSGCKSILAFINARRDGSAAQWFSKLLVVGEGGVGKTSLLRALAGEPHDQNEPSTHGLKIKEVNFEHPDNASITMRLSTWDFGGQEIYHATHQFFLTDRSLFVLLWNSRLGWQQGKLRYWLDIIRAKAPHSPVILIATHTQDRPVDLPLYELRQEYPMIVESLPIDNDTRTGINTLRAKLGYYASRLPLMGSEWPKKWLAAAEIIRNSEERYITPYEMWRRIGQAGVVDSVQQQYIATALHELGDILYYEEDPELCQTVVLQPEWVNEYISMVLDSDEVAESQGVLTRDHLDGLWQGLERGLREHFLGMMDKYDLSYRIEGGTTEVSLVVERLQWDPPNFQKEWQGVGVDPGTQQIRVRYQLNTMPPGIPTWFIARSHRFSQGKHWRTGALLGHQDGKHLALIRADTHRNSIELTVRGPSPSGFFSILDDGLNLTLQRFPGLNITRYVPCPCGDSHDDDCKEIFDYDDLRKRLERRPPRYNIECRKSGEEVSVPQLLLGLAPSDRDIARIEITKLTEAVLRLEEEVGKSSRVISDNIEFLQRLILRSQRIAQAQQEVRCPSVFTIVPIKRKMTSTAYELRLYCEEPGAWHRLPEPAGCYPILKPTDWFQKLGPYVQFLLKALKHTAPLAAPVLGIAVDKLDDQVKSECLLMEELTSQAPDLLHYKDEYGDSLTADLTPTAHAANEADFRALEAMLTKLDLDRAWGGLSRKTTPEGLTLYLCAEHLSRYSEPASSY